MLFSDHVLVAGEVVTYDSEEACAGSHTLSGGCNCMIISGYWIELEITKLARKMGSGRVITLFSFFCGTDVMFQVRNV